jgi:AcrR family transcriptional regulator
VRVRGRAARVLQRVLAATAEQLGRVGYGAMRVEDVAARSGVNKTTIYRRWRTKAELVAATATAMVEQGKQRMVIDTGTVRGDLHASLLSVLDLKPSERGILRMVQAEGAIPEVAALARRLSAELYRARLAMVNRGIERGELPDGVDAKLIVDLVSAPVYRALLANQTLDARYVERVVDIVLSGAAARASAGRPRKRRAS